MYTQEDYLQLSGLQHFAFCTLRGNFLARVSGESSGNVLLRRMQYRMADDLAQCKPLQAKLCHIMDSEREQPSILLSGRPV